MLIYNFNLVEYLRISNLTREMKDFDLTTGMVKMVDDFKKSSLSINILKPDYMPIDNHRIIKVYTFSRCVSLYNNVHVEVFFSKPFFVFYCWVLNKFDFMLVCVQLALYINCFV